MPRVSLPRPVSLCLATFLSLTILSALQLFVFHLHHRNVNPLDLLFPGLTSGADILCFVDRFRFFGTREFFQYPGQPFNYPAPVALVLASIFRMPLQPKNVFRLIFLAWVIISGAFFVRACTKRGVYLGAAVTFTASLLLLGFPTLLLVFLSNLELVVWVVLGIGVWGFYTRRDWLATICFGIAGSFKYFPLAFLGLFPVIKEWRKIAAGIAAFATSLLVSSWIMGPSVRCVLQGLRSQTAIFANFYLHRWHPIEGGVDHSIFALVKVLLLHVHRLDLIPKIFPAYTGIAGLAFVLTYFLFVRKLPILNQLIAISIASVWIVPLSHDYTLVHLYAPCGALTLYSFDSPTTRGLNAMFVCFGVLFASLTFVQFRTILYGGQVRCVALGILFALALLYKMPWMPLDEGRI
jgi:hypothetical protein